MIYFYLQQVAEWEKSRSRLSDRWNEFVAQASDRWKQMGEVCFAPLVLRMAFASSDHVDASIASSDYVDVSVASSYHADDATSDHVDDIS